MNEYRYTVLQIARLSGLHNAMKFLWMISTCLYLQAHIIKKYVYKFWVFWEKILGMISTNRHELYLCNKCFGFYVLSFFNCTLKYIIARVHTYDRSEKRRRSKPTTGLNLPNLAPLKSHPLLIHDLKKDLLAYRYGHIVTEKDCMINLLFIPASY